MCVCERERESVCMAGVSECGERVLCGVSECVHVWCAYVV